MHIDQLPIELLRACLRQLEGPVEATRDELVERQLTLSRCCLVSRTWRAVAPPLLYERIALVVGEPTRQVQRPLVSAVDDDFAREIPDQVDLLWRNLQTRPDLIQNMKLLRLDKRVETSMQFELRHQRRVWEAEPDKRIHLSTLHRKLRALFSHVPRLEELSLYQIKPFDVGTPTIAKSLRKVHAYGTDFECFGSDPEPLPKLVSWSGCGLKFDDMAARILTAEYLPNVRNVAHVFSRTNNVDLSSFPPSVRVVCSSNSRADTAQVAETTLYLLRFDATVPEVRMQSPLSTIVNATTVHHLCLLDAYYKEPATILLEALRTDAALRELRTLRVVSDEDIVSGNDDLVKLIKERKIEVIDTGEWTGDPMRGDMFPPGWV